MSGEHHALSIPYQMAQAKKIKKLEAENSRLRAEVDRLRTIINDAIIALDDAEEINPSNYDHDLVCRLNTAYCAGYGILKEAT